MNQLYVQESYRKRSFF